MRKILGVPLRVSMALLLIATAVVLFSSGPGPGVALASPSTITGTVFNDFSMDGVFDTGEAGVAGAAIRAFDASGTEVSSTMSASNGSYTLSLDADITAEVRVEFTPPSGYQGTFVSEAQGSLGSSVRFVAPGESGVNFGVVDSDWTCGISVAHVCFRQGPLALGGDTRVLGISPWNPAASGNPPKAIGDPGTNTFGAVIANDVDGLISTVATKAQVGSTYGVAFQRSTGLLWNSAVIRRHTSLGPEGIGGVYVVDQAGAMVEKFDLEALGLDLRPLTTAFPSIATAYGDAGGKIVFSEENRDIVGAGGQVISPTGVTYNSRTLDAESRDIPAFATVGKAGIGDIDISQDGNYLWVSNLNTRSVHRFDIGSANDKPTLSNPSSWDLDDGYTCATGTGPLRGWGLDPQPDGTVVAAGVCTNEAATPSSTTGPGLGVILHLDPTETGSDAWTELTTVDFDYEHRYDYCALTTNNMTCSWKSWSDDFDAIKGAQNYSTNQLWWTQPIIMDIATLPDGSFALGINDRFSYMTASSNYAPLDVASPGYVTGYTAGGLRLMCKTETGWAQEDNDGNCEGITSYIKGTPRPTSVSSSFFRNDFQGAHPATAMGALAYAGGVLAYAAMDAAAYFSSGVRWLNTSNGNQVSALTTSGEFGKASGVGDLEAFCDISPLQIGNRVWYDLNGNGIQDPDEPPVEGVTLLLYDVVNDEIVGRAVTNDQGKYYFTSTNTEDPDTPAGDDEFGGGLMAGRSYEILLSNPDDCAAEGPLDGWSLTIQDATTSAGPEERDELIDSDAEPLDPAESDPCLGKVVVAALEEGEINHSFDIGFFNENFANTTTAPPSGGSTAPSDTVESGSSISVSVGDYVWWDTNRDGRQDDSDVPLKNVELRITTVDGDPVVDVFGNPVGPQFTDATGWYSFDDLPPGQYKVCVIAPEGYVPTLEGVGELDQDSSTGCAISRVLTLDGERDPTLDFGFAKADDLLPSAGVKTTGTMIAILFLLVGLALLRPGNRQDYGLSPTRRT